MTSTASNTRLSNNLPDHGKCRGCASTVLRSLLLLLVSVTIAHGADSDSDGLDDAVETNTGVYVSQSDTGTNPNLSDSDHDLIPDALEIYFDKNPCAPEIFNKSQATAEEWISTKAFPVATIWENNYHHGCPVESHLRVYNTFLMKGLGFENDVTDLNP